MGTSSDLRADIIAWVSAEPMRALVTEFGGDPDLVTATPATLGRTLAELDMFTDRWDTRKGRERNLAAELDLTDAQQILVVGITIRGFWSIAAGRRWLFADL